MFQPTCFDIVDFMSSQKIIRVVELFAGVGGFRLGLERTDKQRFQTIWANQWEPNKKSQHAYSCYIKHFGSSPNHVNEDIAFAKSSVPEHDLLVGGFPCQDYSVARTGAQGIEGYKGVLWWEIRDIVQTHRPEYILLENVDRLLKSPASQRGRDFGVMLRCLNDLGYVVEWRVINAADYGFAQRRRRIFIFATRQDSLMLKSLQVDDESLKEWLLHDGLFAQAFPVEPEIHTKKITTSLIDSKHFSELADVSERFKVELHNAGVMCNGKFVSCEVMPISKPFIPLKNILHNAFAVKHKEQQPFEVEKRYFLSDNTEKWRYLKGAKRIPRIKPNGEPYFFAEGAMCFPDNLEASARTMLTSESSINRSSHVVADLLNGQLRLLTPIECERINGFDDNWTNVEGVPHKFRYFAMGNALVVPVVEVLSKTLLQRIDVN